ncbi:regulatory protein RecX [Salsipaludibacter albus]|uniref:regulatory protein RecX n=1 Tax=Salsipaludibacter albus TaxID=2849650 RepID=UPI001EE3DDB4|nr:recombination regulator RecX [Salsipaludibacter albus]
MTGQGHDDLTSRSDADVADEATPFRSAEQWLAERGIEPQPIRVDPGSGDDASDGPPAPADRPPPSAREAAQLATEAPATIPGHGHDPASEVPGADGTDTDLESDAAEPREPGPLMDEVSRAVAFIQRSTARTPASTGRLERKLRDRDVPAAAIPLALQDAAEQGLVDDRAYAAALVAEGREKGHAPRRLRADLRTRELPEDVIETALGEVRDRDPEAVAFDVAQRKARSYRDLDAEKAFRRLVAYLARRGHNEHVARKVARQVVFDDREDDRVAGH